MSGTDILYHTTKSCWGTRERGKLSYRPMKLLRDVRYRCTVRWSCLPSRCPVLALDFGGSICLGGCYEVSGTEYLYDATREGSLSLRHPQEP
eukprot:3078745-Rhodomonas_salina.2